VAATSLGVLAIFGLFNGREASHWCNVRLTTGETAYSQAFSCENPLTETGVVLAAPNQGVFIDENPTITGTLNVGIGSTATASGNNIFDDLNLSLAPRLFPTLGSGATAMEGAGFVKIPPGEFMNGYWGTTSGASLKGELGVGWFLAEIVPCSALGIDC
jgi:hypothetical protein